MNHSNWLLSQWWRTTSINGEALDGGGDSLALAYSLQLERKTMNIYGAGDHESVCISVGCDYAVQTKDNQIQ